MAVLRCGESVRVDDGFAMHQQCSCVGESESMWNESGLILRVPGQDSEQEGHGTCMFMHTYMYGPVLG